MKWVIAAALVTGLLSGCDNEPTRPYWSFRCVKEETVTKMVYWPSSGGGLGITPYGVGIHLGGGMHMVTTTECVQYDSTLVVPTKWQ